LCKAGEFLHQRKIMFSLKTLYAISCAVIFFKKTH
jgi:hypothetical protein